MLEYQIEDLTIVVDESYDENVSELLSKAEAFEAEDNLPKALDSYNKAVRAASGTVGPRLKQAGILKKMGRWPQYVDALNDVSKKLPDEMLDEKIALLKLTVPVLRDEMKIQPKVMDAYKKILALKPDDEDTFTELVEMIKSMSRWPDLAKTYKAHLEHVESEDRKIELLEELAEVYTEKMHNVREAVKVYEELLELDPLNDSAIENLKKIYEQSRNYEGLIKIQQKELEIITDPEERKAKTVEIAETASSKIKKPEIVIALWEDVLKEDPENEKALEALEALYERTKNWEKVVEVSEKLLEIIVDDKKKSDICLKLAPIYQTRLENIPKAIETWKLLLEIKPSERRAQDSLKKLMAAEKQWDELEELFREWGKLEEYIRIISKEVDHEKETEDKVALLMREAKIWRDELGKNDRAIKAYEKLLSVDPKHLESANALIELYQEANAYKKLPNVLEIRIEFTEDEDLKRERMEELAEIYLSHLKNKEEAFNWYIKAFAINPENEDTREKLEELAASVKEGWARLVEEYEKAYDFFADPMNALPLMLVVIKAQEEELSNPDKALETSIKILEIDESNETALDACERIYRQQQKWEDLLGIYDKQIELSADDEKRKDFYWNKAEIYDTLLEQPENAVENYRAALDIIPDDLNTLEKLDVLYSRLEKWEELSEILEKELEFTEDEAQKTEFKYRWANLQETKLDKLTDAIEGYKEVLEKDPSHENARLNLEKHLDNEDVEVKRTAADILEPIYKTFADYEKLVKVHEIQAETEDDPERKLELYLTIGNIWAEQAGNIEKAFDAYARGVKNTPSSDEARANLEKIAEIEEKWADVLKVYEEVLENEYLDDEIKKIIHIKVATIAKNLLEDNETAISNYRKALEIDSTNIDILNNLEELYTAGENWSELYDISKRKLELADELEERQALRFRCGELLDQKLEQPKEAVSMYDEVLGEEPDNIQALKALDNLYLKLENWSELADNLIRQLELTTELEAQSELMRRLAKVQHEKLESTELAVETWRKALELNGEDELVIAELEKLLDNEEFGLTVAKILEPVYKSLGRWKELIRVYEIIKDNSYDPSEKINLLHQIANIYEEMGDDTDNAFDAFSRSMKIDPMNEETRDNLERISRDSGKWDRLFELYSEMVENAEDETVAINIQTRIGDLYASETGNIEKAAEAYNKLLEIKSDYIPAVEALEQLFMQNGDIKRMVEAILRKVELIYEPEEKKELAFKVAEIQKTELEDIDAAISTYRLILEIDDTETRALDALENIFVEREDWDNVKTVYARKAELAPDLEERKHMLKTLGQLYDVDLKDSQSAIETYEKIIDEDPEDIDALQQLDRLYEAAEQWSELINILESEIQVSQVETEISVLKLRLGEVYELKLNEVGTAVPLYGESLEIDRTNNETVSALTRVIHGGEEGTKIEYEVEVRLDACNILDKHYTESGELEPLIDVLNVRVDLTEDSYEKVTNLHRLAEIHESFADDLESARNDMGRALKVDPANEKSREEIERLSGTLQSWDWLIKLYEEIVESLEDETDKIVFLTKIARIYEEEIDQPEKAIENLNKILEINPEHWNTLEALDRLYSSLNKWEELTGILNKEIEYAQSPEAILDYRNKLAALYEDQLNDPEKAVDAFKAILQDTPDYEPAREGLENLLVKGVKPTEIYEVLEDLYRQDENWERLIELIEKVLVFEKDPEERLRLFKYECDLYENYLMDVENAFRTWGRVFSETAVDDEVNDKLEEIASRISIWEDLVEIYRNKAQAVLAESDSDESKELAIQIWLKAARVSEEEISDFGGAVECNLAVLDIDPNMPVALESLDRIYTNTEMYEDLDGILFRRSENTDDSYDKIQLLFRLAEIRENYLRNVDGAVDALERILKEEPDNMDALEKLENLHLYAHNWQDLYNVYKRMNDVFSSDTDIVESLSHMAKIASDGLKNDAKAEDLWKEVLELSAEDPRALAELAVLAEKREDWEATVDYLERVTQASFETEEQVSAYLNYGRICLEQLEDHRKAMDAYTNVLSIQPDNMEALKKLAFIYNESQAWEELVDILERIVEYGAETMSSKELADYYAQIGKIEKEYLVRLERAINAWEEVIRINPGYSEALEALEILYVQNEDWFNTIRILKEKVNIAPNKEARRELLFRIASLWEEKLDAQDEAAKVYLEIFNEDKLNAKAMDNLERIYTDLSRWDDLIDLYFAKYEALGGQKEEIPEENKEEIVLLLQKMALVSEEKQSNRESAFDALSLAFEIDPVNNITAERLERIVGVDDNWQELLDMYGEAVEMVQDRLVKCNLLVKMGKWYSEQLEDLDKATEVLKQALKMEPNYGAVHLALADVHKKNQSWGEYIDELKKALEVEETKEGIYQAAMELAKVHEKEFADFMEAVRYYKIAHEAMPEKQDALFALERLYEKTESWRELVGIIKERVDQSQNDEEIIDLKYRMAELLDDRREAPSKAIEVLNEILEAHPDHLPTMRFLERLYDKVGDMEEYLALLENQMNYITNDEERIVKYHQMAAVWEEHYENTEKAIECYESILEINDKDEHTYRNLARLYRQEKKWSEYIDTIYRHIDISYDSSEKIRLYKFVAETLEKHLEEPERAIDAYNSILQEDPEDIEALTALSRLYEQQEDWDNSLEISQQLVKVIDDQKVKVELYHRIGRIYEEQRMDWAEAERLYAEALALNPSYIPSLHRLSKMYESNGDWLKATRMLEKAKEHTGNMVDKAKYLYEAGKIYFEYLEETEHAAELLSQCLEIDPENVEAALLYTDILWQKEEYEAMYPHAQVLVRKLKHADPPPDKEVLVKAHFRYGKAAEAKGELDKALKAYHEAYSLEKTSLDILLAMAGAFYALQKWDKAFSAYKQILVHPQAEGDTELHVTIYYNLGNIKFQEKDYKRALNYYEKALEENMYHRPTLEKMVELYEKERNYKAAARIKEQIAELIDNEDEKIEIYREIGDYYKEKVKDINAAIEMKKKAFELNPEDGLIISELADLYQESKQWKKMVKLLKHKAELEKDPKIRAIIWYSIAGIYRSFIKSMDDAVEYYNLALDDDVSLLKAFRHIDEILTNKKDWKQQERNYRKFLKRVMENTPENEALILNLWDALAEIHRSRLRDFSAAIQSFEAAMKMDPDNMGRLEKLAELHDLAGPDHAEAAIEKYQQILDIQPDHDEALKSLYRLYMETREYDKSWCIAAVLNYLGRADSEELDFYNQYKQRGFIRLQQRFTPDLWNKYLISPNEDPFLRSFFANLSVPISMVKGRPYKQWGLNKKNRQEYTTEGPTFNTIFFYVLDRMAVEVPELYLFPDRRGEIQHAVIVDRGQRIPFVTVGQNLLQGHMEKDLAFIIARELTYMRPEHYLIKIASSAGELRGLMLGAIRLVNPSVPLKGDPAVINQTAQQLNQLLPPANKEKLFKDVTNMLRLGDSPGVGSYLQAVESTAHRVALSVVNDLETAMMVVQSEPIVADGLSLQQKTINLLRFATSETYFSVRKYLGVSIG